MDDVANQRRYALCLGDGSRWLLAADAYLEAWVERLARVMDLKRAKACGGQMRLLFCRMDGHGGAASGPEANGLNGQVISLDLKTVRTRRLSGVCDVVCEVNNSKGYETEVVNMWHATQPIFFQSMESGGLPFHAALVELDGRGILLAAPGDSGKSTCCGRLPGYWKALCDDETLIVFNGRQYVAHPFPTWSDYLFKHTDRTWDVQHSVPLEAIFFLEQRATDDAVPVGAGRAAAMICDSASQVCRKFWKRSPGDVQRDTRRRIFSNAGEIAKRVPAFLLGVSLQGRFWEKIEEIIC